MQDRRPAPPSRTRLFVAAALFGQLLMRGPLAGESRPSSAIAGTEEGAEAVPPEAAASAPSEPSPPSSPWFLVDRLAAGGSFGWLSSHSLRYLARIHFDFPFFVARHKGLYIRGALSSSISRIESEKIFRFHVEDADYLFEAGARDYLSPRVAVAAFAGQQGSENLDRPGSARVRYFGLGAQSATFPRPGGESRLDWNLNLGAVFDHLGIEGDWVVRADLLWDALKLNHSTIGVDLSVDSLVFAGNWHSDSWAGPRWSFDLPNGIRASLFARYLRSRNPLGVGASGTHIGFTYSEGAYRGPREGPFPDVRGVLSAGPGKNRSPGSFNLEADFPPFHVSDRRARPFIEVDANALAGSGPDNVYYKLTAGLEVDLTPSVVAGGYLRHRSYHLLAEGNDSPSDLNLLEAGIRSAGWDFSDRSPGQLIASPPTRWPGALEWKVGASYVLSSSVPADPRWIGTCGLRWDMPGGHGYNPYLLASGDAGKASRLRAGVGLTLPVDMTVSAEYRRDSLLQGDKHNVALLFSLYY